MSAIPGYDYGSPQLATSYIGPAELEQLKATLMFAEEDERLLRLAGEVLGDQVEQILDDDQPTVDGMCEAWFKAVVLTAALWSRPYADSEW